MENLSGSDSDPSDDNLEEEKLVTILGHKQKPKKSLLLRKKQKSRLKRIKLRNKELEKKKYHPEYQKRL